MKATTAEVWKTSKRFYLNSNLNIQKCGEYVTQKLPMEVKKLCIHILDIYFEPRLISDLVVREQMNAPPAFHSMRK